MNHLLCILVSFLLSAALMALVLPLLRKLGAGQSVLSYVKQHASKNGTPTMGGLTFVAALSAASLIFDDASDNRVALTLAVTAGFAVVGFLDDFIKIRRRHNEGLKPYQKILFQLAIAVIAAAYCYINGITSVNVPFGGGIAADIGAAVVPLVLFVFVATVNCVNLTDGLDGLAAGTSAAYLVSLGTMLNITGGFGGATALAGAGALAGFLLFNTNKASVLFLS